MDDAARDIKEADEIAERGSGLIWQGEIVGYHCRNGEIERLQAQIDSLEDSGPTAQQLT